MEELPKKKKPVDHFARLEGLLNEIFPDPLPNDHPLLPIFVKHKYFIPSQGQWSVSRGQRHELREVQSVGMRMTSEGGQKAIEIQNKLIEYQTALDEAKKAAKHGEFAGAMFIEQHQRSIDRIDEALDAYFKTYREVRWDKLEKPKKKK